MKLSLSLSLSTADSPRHHCKLGGGSASIPGTMSERNALGFRHTNGSERSLPRVRCVPKKRVWAEGQQASAAEPITGDTRSTTDLPGTPEPHRANEERPERKDLIWMKTKRQILLGANVGG
jgi:hypothetical protein